MNKIFRLNQLRQLISAHFQEIIREPGVLFWGILFPILMSLGLGLAFSRKPEVIRKVAVIRTIENQDTAASQLSRFLEKSCIKNQAESGEDYKWKYDLNDDKLGSSVFLFYELDWNEAMVKLKRGTVNLILKSNNGKTEYHFDPVNSDAELIYLKLHNVIRSGEVFTVKSNSEIRPLTVEGTRYIDFLVPGLITMGVMMSTMWGISYGLIEKRSKKLLRRLVATPMKKSHFLIALITVRVTMNFIEAFILILFALIAFNMTIQGSIPALIMMFVSGNIAFAGIAVFASCHTSNTEVGNGLINAIVMPMMILSGIFFSYQNFPDWSVRIIKTLPLTMMTDGVRSIFNEGAGYNEVIIPVIALSAIGIIFFSAGLKVFKWY
jgi:ABC-2 type transport system permease protein